MDFHETPRLPAGFRCAARNCGLKTADPDLSIFVSDVPARAAALFTRNHFPGAPVVVGRERIRKGVLQAIVVNSKVSNVATGPEGVEDALLMGHLAAGELGLPDELVLMSSTGVIGRRLPMEKIRSGLAGVANDLGRDPWPAARGIMTTDTEPKVLSLALGGGTLTAVGKGAGMIAPNLATMLVFLFTDAELETAALGPHLSAAAGESFQRLSVDTDTSTSDTVVLMANGLAGPVAAERFRQALTAICRRMAEWIARDGEGATKLIRVTVDGAASDEDGRQVARSVVDSPLVKTMAFGQDPNVGRVLMAIGKCFDCRITPDCVSARIQGVEVIRGGLGVPFVEAEVRELLGKDPVEISISLGVGDGRGIAFGCDLTEGYIRENAAYASS